MLRPAEVRSQNFGIQNGLRRGIQQLADLLEQLAWFGNTVAGVLILTPEF